VWVISFFFFGWGGEELALVDEFSFLFDEILLNQSKFRSIHNALKVNASRLG